MITQFKFMLINNYRYLNKLTTYSDFYTELSTGFYRRFRYGYTAEYDGRSDISGYWIKSNRM